MAGTRALFASIGASVALVAAAALSLLAVSAVFAFGGWSDSPSPSFSRPALIFAGSTLSPPANATRTQAGTTRIVVAAPARRAKPRADRPARGSRASADTARRELRSTISSGASAAPRFDPPATPVVRPTAPAAAPKPKTGDRVRKVGDSLSSTVQGTGAALADATKPLAAPVSAAVQQVLNLVAEIVRRTTGGLGGALDGLLPPK